MHTDHHENHCDCKYFYGVFEIENSTQFGFQIGYKNDEDEIETLCTKGEYDTPHEAEIAATAFLAGMNFLREVSQ